MGRGLQRALNVGPWRENALMVDMTTGVSRVESDSGRVQGLFTPPPKQTSGKKPSSEKH